MNWMFWPLAACLLAACAALAGCGLGTSSPEAVVEVPRGAPALQEPGPGANSPEAVAEKVFKGAMAEQDFEAILPLVSGDAVYFVEVCQEELTNIPEEDLPVFHAFQEVCANASVVEKTLGESEATITYRVEWGSTASLHLTKDPGGFWKVDWVGMQ